MKILITGASSFTGKILMPMLENAGYETFMLVRRDQGFKRQFVWNFTDDLPEDIPECQAIVHLAASVDFQNNLNISQYGVNTISTAKLAAYACKKKSHFIFTSTVSIHGSMFSEYNSATPINPESNYAMSKYMAEMIVRTFARSYTILRIGGVYGLNGPNHLSLNMAIANAYHKKEIPTIKGLGKAKRNYICVYDVAQWIFFLLKRHEMNADMHMHTREILYLAGPEVMTVETYLREIIEILLSGNDIHRIDGMESKDMVIKFTPFPFKPIMFRQYLESLKSGINPRQL
jgi:nucleoside-diphosphate-sugar epimerase